MAVVAAPEDSERNPSRGPALPRNVVSVLEVGTLSVEMGEAPPLANRADSARLSSDRRRRDH